MKSNTSLILKRLMGVTPILLASVVLAFLGSAPAFADNPYNGQPYFSLSGMLVSAGDAEISPTIPALQLEADPGFGVVGAFGWLYDSNWRTEIELGYRKVGMDSIGSAALEGDLGIFTGFVNVVRDFRGESFLTPYAGLGIGAAYRKLRTQEAWSPAYQVMLGLTFEVGDNVDIYTGYRYMGALREGTGVFVWDSLATHNLEVGLRFYLEDWFK